MEVSQMSEECYLNFSTDKTKAMIFTRRPYEPVPLLSFCSSEIECTNIHKFLGLNFNSKLTWKYHVKDLLQKSEKALSLLKYISSNIYGIDRELPLYLFKVTLGFKLDYGSFI